ncbi:MAG TPA: hypothetical protein PKM32_05065 [Planctomycetota bacterium]|mgnify:CR=1 FL=1|jgi:predicted  nucleic acid-binding Zn-ribbon protein|nr:hypothetical protein [Planctomycetota bacterium]HPY75612.1 hypothetical protein [Planctomycetota bacterium]HQB01381.1 hypothetical protein [Planctomycetota bacterium]
MRKIIVFLLIFTCAMNVMAQQTYSTPQKKVAARRAAILDGYRQLAEAIQGVHITSETTVKDMVTEDDQLSIEMEQTVIRGASIVATRYNEDNTCEVDMEIRLSDIVLFMLNQGKNKNFDAQTMFDSNPEEVIRATGMGAPMEDKTAEDLAREAEERKQREEKANYLVENQQLREQIQELQSKQADPAVSKKLQDENTHLKTRVEQLQQQNAQLSNEIKTWNTNNAQWQEQQKQWQTKEQQISGLQLQNSQLKSQNNQLTQQIQQLQTQNDSLQAQNKILQAQADKSATPSTAYVELITANEQLRAQVQELQFKLNQSSTNYTQDVYNQLQATIEQLTQENNNLKAQISSNHYNNENYLALVQENNQLRMQVQQLQYELNTSENSADIAQLQQQIQELMSENEKLQEELDNQSSKQFPPSHHRPFPRRVPRPFPGRPMNNDLQVRQLQEQNDQLTNQINQQTRELQEKNTKINLQDQEIKNLQKQLQNLQTVNSNLQRQIQELRKANPVKPTPEQLERAKRMAIDKAKDQLQKQIYALKVNHYMTLQEFILRNNISHVIVRILEKATIKSAQPLNDKIYQVSISVPFNVIVRELEENLRRNMQAKIHIVTFKGMNRHTKEILVIANEIIQ